MAVLTTKYYNDAIDSFIKNVTNSNKAYYVFVGKTDPWLDVNGVNIDENPPAANSSIAQIEQQTYQDIIYGKKIGPSDVSYMISRYNWANNTLYDCYNQNNDDVSNSAYYVITDTFQVFKCIFNNYGANSTVKPALNSTTGTFTTSDGYIWKYMYTIDSNANTKFTTSEYVPVSENTIVANNAVPGTIDYIAVENSGINYQTFAKGSIVSVIDNYTLQLDANASPITDFYTGSSIYLSAGFGAGQLQQIRSYNGLNKQIYTLNPLNIKAHLELSSVNNPQNIVVGTLVTQSYDNIATVYTQGYFQVGDVVSQTDAGSGNNSFAVGTVLAANSSTIQIDRSTSNTFTLNYPIFNTAYTGNNKVGTVSIISGSNTVVGVGTNFSDANTANASYSVGSYIRIGSNTSLNIRRVTAITNSTALSVDLPFNYSLTANVHYNMKYVFEPSSIASINANANISEINLTGEGIYISNSQIAGISFYEGETVLMVDSSNISQSVNATVTFANSSSMVLSNVMGGNFQQGYYVFGASSNQKAFINQVYSHPNITTTNALGKFINGRTIYFTDPTNINNRIANGVLTASYYIPNELTNYIISPTVSISGDGEGATAYSVVNAVSNSISSIVMVNPGNNYSYANASIVANNIYGMGATLSPIISPINGHGSNPYEELGANYVAISKTFANAAAETYHFPATGSYRKIGVIEDPLFVDVTVGLNNFTRGKGSIYNYSGNTFIPGEVVLQPSTKTGGVVVFSNSTFIEIDKVTNTFISNSMYSNGAIANDNIVGLISRATANMLSYAPTYFTLGSQIESVSEVSSGAYADIAQIISNNSIKLTNVEGQLDINDVLYDPVTNAYATVSTIAFANGQQSVSTTFGSWFNQTARVTLSSSQGTFVAGEKVIQEVSNTSGYILSTNTEIDLAIQNPSGSYAIGQTVSSVNTGATGIISFANNSYLKLTSISGNFLIGNQINSTSGSITSSVTSVYPVLLLKNINGQYNFEINNTIKITGQTSNAFGYAGIANTVTNPLLVRNSGKVIYLENIQPFTKSNTSVETISFVIKV